MVDMILRYIDGQQHHSHARDGGHTRRPLWLTHQHPIPLMSSRATASVPPNPARPWSIAPRASYV